MLCAEGGPMENPGAGLPNLKTINVASENPYWVSKDGVMYQREEDNKLALATYPRKKTDLSFSVGEDVSWIPSGTGMDRNSFLENIVFKSGKTTIGVEALNGNSLKNVYLDFEDEDTGDTGLYLDGFKFDYYGSEEKHSHNIYMQERNIIEAYCRRITRESTVLLMKNYKKNSKSKGKDEQQ